MSQQNKAWGREMSPILTPDQVRLVRTVWEMQEGANRDLDMEKQQKEVSTGHYH